MKKIIVLTILGLSLVFFLVSTPSANGSWTKIWGPVGQVEIAYLRRDGQYETVIFATKRSTGDTYKYDGSPMNWTRIGGGHVKMFAPSGNMGLFAIPSDLSGVWYYLGTPLRWRRVRGPAKEIYGGRYGLFATKLPSEDLYRYRPKAFRWTKVGGPRSELAFTNTKVFALSLWETPRDF